MSLQSLNCWRHLLRLNIPKMPAHDTATRGLHQLRPAPAAPRYYLAGVQGSLQPFILLSGHKLLNLGC